MHALPWVHLHWQTPVVFRFSVLSLQKWHEIFKHLLKAISLHGRIIGVSGLLGFTNMKNKRLLFEYEGKLFKCPTFNILLLLIPL